MVTVMNESKPGIHPQKYVMWIALVGIVMMFAGLTSAVIVKRNQANWLSFNIPLIFWYSTAVIIVSSVTIFLCRKAYLNREMKKYKTLLLVTGVLGVLFVAMQYFGFNQLWDSGITLTRNVSFSFLYVIVGLHAAHVIGGIIGLIVIYIKSNSTRKKIYSSVPIDIMSTYWHFVGILWIYLLIFLTMMN